MDTPIKHPGYMPGQTPYTEAEHAAVRALMSDTLDAEEEFGLDELEAYAAQQRQKEQTR